METIKRSKRSKMINPKEGDLYTFIEILSLLKNNALPIGTVFACNDIPFEGYSAPNLVVVQNTAYDYILREDVSNSDLLGINNKMLSYNWQLSVLPEIRCFILQHKDLTTPEGNPLYLSERVKVLYDEAYSSRCTDTIHSLVERDPDYMGSRASDPDHESSENISKTVFLLEEIAQLPFKAHDCYYVKEVPIVSVKFITPSEAEKEEANHEN